MQLLVSAPFVKIFISSPWLLVNCPSLGWFPTVDALLEWRLGLGMLVLPNNSDVTGHACIEGGDDDDDDDDDHKMEEMTRRWRGEGGDEDEDDDDNNNDDHRLLANWNKHLQSMLVKLIRCQVPAGCNTGNMV